MKVMNLKTYAVLGMLIATTGATASTEECSWKEKQDDYRGDVSVTEEGLDCQAWNVQTPQKHNMWRAEKIAGPFGLGEHAFCRNPDNSDRAWCYTTKPGFKFQYCNVPRCKIDDDCKLKGKKIDGKFIYNPRTPSIEECYGICLRMEKCLGIAWSTINDVMTGVETKTCNIQTEINSIKDEPIFVSVKKECMEAKKIVHCDEGQRYSLSSKACEPCAEGSWSAGGATVECTPCPQGKTVAEGMGSAEEKCKEIVTEKEKDMKEEKEIKGEEMKNDNEWCMYSSAGAHYLCAALIAASILLVV